MSDSKPVTLRQIHKEIELMRQDLSWLNERIDAGMQELSRIKKVINEAIEEFADEQGE